MNKQQKEIGYKADGTYHDLLWIIHNDGDLEEFKSLYYEDYEWFTDMQRLNLFHDAAFYGRNDIAEYMILSSYVEDLQKTFEYYNDWNNYKKENIALIAAKYGNIDLLDFILNICPYLADETNENDDNILHLLLEHIPEQYRKIAELIEEHRLHDLYKQQNRNGCTPIEYVKYAIDNVIYQAVQESRTNAEIEAENNKVDLLV